MGFHLPLDTLTALTPHHTIHQHQIIIIFYNTYAISTPIAPNHPSVSTRHIWTFCPPPARRSSSPAVSTEPPAYSIRFLITTPDSTPSRCRCQVYTSTEPPDSIQDTFQKGTFLHIYWKYCRIAVDFIYIQSSKNTIFHKRSIYLS